VRSDSDPELECDSSLTQAMRDTISAMNIWTLYSDAAPAVKI
jgi:hypothetical protein